MVYKVKLTKEFERRFKKLARQDQKLRDRIIKTIIRLRRDPYERGLRTHKAESLNYGRRPSSRVTGDLRIVWDFDREDRNFIHLLTIDGHSGKRKVYKRSS